MATTVEVETLFEGSTLIVKQVNIAATAGDETSDENVVIDLSTLVGPGGLGNSVLDPTGDLSLLEATWSIASAWDGCKLYWHDEGNDDTIINMVGDSAISFRGIGGKNYGAEAEAGDGDVLLDVTNGAEAAGSALMVFVFKKKL